MQVDLGRLSPSPEKKKSEFGKVLQIPVGAVDSAAKSGSYAAGYLSIRCEGARFRACLVVLPNCFGDGAGSLPMLQADHSRLSSNNFRKTYCPSPSPSQHYNRANMYVLIDSIILSYANSASRAEVLLGITGKDFTLIAASNAAMRGATILKATDNKTRPLNKHTLMAYSGEAGDTSKYSPTPVVSQNFPS